MRTDKIDFLTTGAKLTITQKDIAISILKKIGCFEVESDQAHTQKRFYEEEVIDRLFYNYKLGTDYEKLVRLITDIIDYYRFIFTAGRGVNHIARLYYPQKGKRSAYFLICKPNKGERVKEHNIRVKTAVTHVDKADRIQHENVIDIPQKCIPEFVNRLCAKRPLEERTEILKDFISAAQDKLIEVSKEVALLEASDKLQQSIEDGTDKTDMEGIKNGNKGNQ